MEELSRRSRYAPGRRSVGADAATAGLDADSQQLQWQVAPVAALLAAALVALLGSLLLVALSQVASLAAVHRLERRLPARFSEPPPHRQSLGPLALGWLPQQQPGWLRLPVSRQS